MCFVLEVSLKGAGSRIGHPGCRIVLTVIGLGRTGNAITQSRIKIMRARQARGLPFRPSQTVDGTLTFPSCFFWIRDFFSMAELRFLKLPFRFQHILPPSLEILPIFGSSLRSSLIQFSLGCPLSLKSGSMTITCTLYLNLVQTWYEAYRINAT
jgi:hypothetical protein